jgi:hypothetical protein
VCRNLAFRMHPFARQDLKAFWIFAHAVRGAVENCRLAICAEDFEVENCEDCAGRRQAYEDEAEVEGLLGRAGGFLADGEVLPGDASGVVYYGD